MSVKLTASATGMTNGTLRCDCYEYPVIHGIAVLRQMSPVSSIENGAVQSLRSGNAEGAFRWLLGAGSVPGVASPRGFSVSAARGHRLIRKARDFLRRSVESPPDAHTLQAEGFAAALSRLRPRGYADYLFQRFANPSFLGALPPLLVLGETCKHRPRRRLLDLLCGVGHSSAMIKSACPDIEVMMADMDFVNLCIARRYLAPDAPALCLDVELPLPLRDDAIDAVFCLDGLHYVRSKTALAKELDRVLGPDGAWLFAHMHNAKRDNVNPGVPLDSEGYSQRFAFGHWRMLPESEILRQFRADGSLDLVRQPPAAAVDSSHALTLIGARTDELWRLHAGLDTALTRRPQLLEFNPLYRVERTPDGVLAMADWPSDALRRECAEPAPLLGETVHVSAKTLEEIATARAGGGLSGEVRTLLRSFVLVPLPECYPRTGLS